MTNRSPFQVEYNLNCKIGVKPKEKTPTNAFNVMMKAAGERAKIPSRITISNAKDEIYNNVIAVRNTDFIFGKVTKDRYLKNILNEIKDFKKNILNIIVIQITCDSKSFLPNSIEKMGASGTLPRRNISVFQSHQGIFS